MWTFFKSVLVGLAAVVAAILITFATMISVLMIRSRPMQGHESIGWDPISLVHQSPGPALVLLVAFCLGFWWEFARATR